MNFNPSMFENLRQNMTHADAKSNAQRMATMSDDELKNYARMAGMPQMTPEMMRMSAQMMSGMDSNQFNQYKDMSKNYQFPTGGATPTPTPKSTATPSINRSQSTAASTASTSSSEFPKIDKLKQKGNEHFKKGDYDKASSDYFEAILEVEEVRLKNPKLDSIDLTTLEISCRLNYATVKAKQSEWDISMEQALKVLTFGTNGKAYFRLGQAQYHLGKTKEAVINLRKAHEMLSSDQSVKELLDKCEAEFKPKEAEPKQEKEEEKPATASTSVGQASTSTGTKLKKKGAGADLEVDSDTTTTTATKKNHNNDNYSIYEETKKSTSDPKPQAPANSKSDDVHIEEEVKTSTSTSSSTATQSQPSSMNSSFMDTEKIMKGKEEFAKMKPEQVKGMTDYLKNADPAFLRQMFKSQTGMDMSDDQINMMKSMMTPELLQQGINNTDPSQIAAAMRAGGAGSNTTPSTTTAPSQPFDMAAMSNLMASGAQPDISTLMSNPDLMSNMMGMLSSNPDMIKNMSKMMGENNPLAKFIGNRSPEDIEKMMKSMTKLMGFAQKVSPVFMFFKKYWKFMLTILIAYIFFKITG